MQFAWVTRFAVLLAIGSGKKRYLALMDVKEAVTARSPIVLTLLPWPITNARAYSGRSAAPVPDRVCNCASRRLRGIPKVRFLWLAI
jgi:hypothetical protein